MGSRRKDGARYPSGQLKHHNKRSKLKPDVEPISGALYQRIRQYGMKQFGVDPRLHTELARLNLFGELTVAMTAAGLKIAEIYGRYEGLRGFRRSTKSPSYNASYGEAGVAEELMDAATIAELEAKIRSATEAFERLVGRAAVWNEETGKLDPPEPGLIPSHMRNAIETLCVQDQSISPVLYENLREVLQQLAVVWSIQSGAPPRGGSSRALRGPALHFNKHEEDSGTTAKPVKKLASADRVAFGYLMRKLHPSLEEKTIDKLYNYEQALKAREQLEREKNRKRDHAA